MKAYKIELLCLDPNGDCDIADMIYELKNQKYFCSNILSVKEAEIGEWEDDQPINRNPQAINNYELKDCNWK